MGTIVNFSAVSVKHIKNIISEDVHAPVSHQKKETMHIHWD